MGLAFLITTERLQLLSERKVLKESEYAALLDAAGVLDTARQEARRIVQQATHQAQESRRQGYEAGVAQARTEYAQRLLAVAAQSHAELQGLREVMARLVVKAVSQLVAEADPAQLFEAALLRVDNLIRHEPHVTVRVSPNQEAALRSVLQRMRDAAQWTMTVAVQADPALPDGACVMQTPSGTLEIGVDAQIEAFRRAVARGGA
ncbi:type III secretion system stator protein SctL [Ideonella sp. BN130291]|uniref:type III secretion system stator protein SctL n=1 Tax=Ideonella sp. BN130291 TaxID=3112940 RepID=UPI002E272E8B|nr:type III secretion system stator protein SctL [Ideonella sp. BN130291]